MSKTIFAERSVTITRVLKAPRKLVWEVWTDPKHLKEWWGPEQFTNPRVEGEVKLGGVMNITMRGPKGSPWDRDLPMTARYVEIVPGKKLVFENEPLGPNGEQLLEGITTVTFADHAEGTLMEMTTTAKALTEDAVAMLAGMDQGWSSSFNKLERYLQNAR